MLLGGLWPSYWEIAIDKKSTAKQSPSQLTRFKMDGVLSGLFLASFYNKTSLPKATSVIPTMVSYVTGFTDLLLPLVLQTKNNVF